MLRQISVLYRERKVEGVGKSYPKKDFGTPTPPTALTSGQKAVCMADAFGRGCVRCRSYTEDLIFGRLHLRFTPQVEREYALTFDVLP
jgi:hypothetical protein